MTTMFRKVYGLDLGTYEIKIYDKKRDRIRSAKTVIAMQHETEVLAVGSRAYLMEERAPADIRVVFPMRGGVIAQFREMQFLLCELLPGKTSFHTEYLLAIPTDVTAVDKKAFYDLVCHSMARAKTVRVVERGLADAVGMGVDVHQEKGILVANFGGETTELSVISKGKVLVSRLLPVGGRCLDDAVIEAVRSHCEFLIGRPTAGQLRMQFGIAGDRKERPLSVAGRDLVTGMAGKTSVSSSLIRRALKKVLLQTIVEVERIQERIPLDVYRQVKKRGICLTGGLAKLSGLDAYLEAQTGLFVHKTANSRLSAIQGIRQILSDPYYRDLAHGISDEDYRWLR